MLLPLVSASAIFTPRSSGWSMWKVKWAARAPVDYASGPLSPSAFPKLPWHFFEATKRKSDRLSGILVNALGLSITVRSEK